MKNYAKLYLLSLLTKPIRTCDNKKMCKQIRDNFLKINKLYSKEDFIIGRIIHVEGVINE